MDKFCPRKGVKYALDYIGDSFDSLVSGIVHRLHDQRGHSRPDGYCDHHVSGAHYSGKKILQRFNPLPEKVTYGERNKSNEKEKYFYPVYIASYGDRRHCRLDIDTHTGKCR
jgi:hypothetical protein